MRKDKVKLSLFTYHMIIYGENLKVSISIYLAIYIRIYICILKATSTNK